MTCLTSRLNKLPAFTLEQDKEGGDVLIAEGNKLTNVMSKDGSILTADFKQFLNIVTYSKGKGKVLFCGSKVFGKKITLPVDLTLNVVLSHLIVKDKSEISVEVIRTGDKRIIAAAKVNLSGVSSLVARLNFAFDDMKREGDCGFHIRLSKSNDDEVLVGDNNITMLSFTPRYDI
jgi:hypothetical protein